MTRHPCAKYIQAVKVLWTSLRIEICEHPQQYVDFYYIYWLSLVLFKRPKTPGAAPYLDFFDLDVSKRGGGGMARTRSGSHLHRRGEIYYYRRIVPAEYRAAFGQVVVSKSLTTTSQTEAERLEKQHDAEFERRLCEARDASDPEAVAMSIADPVRVVVNSPNSYRYASDELAEKTVLSDEQRETAEVLIGERLHQRLTQAGNINVLLSDLRNVLP